METRKDAVFESCMREPPIRIARIDGLMQNSSATPPGLSYGNVHL